MAATDREFLINKMSELKDTLNDKFGGCVTTSPTLPLKGGNTQKVTFSAVNTGNTLVMCTVYVADNDTFIKGDVVKPDNTTVAFNLIQEKSIPIRINLHCFTLDRGLIHTSNFRVGYNTAKNECDVTLVKVQGETDSLKEQIEKLKTTLSGIHTLSAPPANE